MGLLGLIKHAPICVGGVWGLCYGAHVEQGRKQQRQV